jgi:hypothetical protein
MAIFTVSDYKKPNLEQFINTDFQKPLTNSISVEDNVPKTNLERKWIQLRLAIKIVDCCPQRSNY